MSDVENIYCRLCAELKPNNKLIDLKTDDEKSQEIVTKLTRLHIELNDNMFPKTVCLMCVTSLQSAYEFVTTVEQAQTVLNDLILVRQIKKEKNVSDDENDVTEVPDDTCQDYLVVKVESKPAEPKPTESSSKAVEKGPKKGPQVYRKRNLSPTIEPVPVNDVKLSWKDYSWMCSYCDTLFPNVDELKTHSMEFHNACNAFRCTDCRRRKLRLDSFLIHVCRHRKHLKFSCYKCPMKFATVKVGNYHRTKHINSNYVCLGCNTNFTTKKDLNSHASKYYKETRVRKLPDIPQDDTLTCVICHKTCRNRGSLNVHLLTHTDRKKNHTCEVCGKCFFQKGSLAEHMLQHTNERPFPCEICKFSFKTSRQLRRHVGVHDGIKPFACDQCGRCFRLKKQLLSHSIIHTDSFPHVCSYCNKGFRFKTILNQHLRQHTGVKPYNCSICQRDFTNWPNFNKHMKRRHGTDMAKKKHTPEGTFPINSAGDVIYPAGDCLDWRKKIMMATQKEKPKVDDKIETVMQRESVLTGEVSNN
ncbi:gastrula zinc finger protein XlCGF57.1-like [Trichoplusia ni]|uniref:Gastrula zinc finger protein XlCGF57.1-like n=1 Tax=Trichoplusia ni TaxID=7111 RepID=A0A7E5WP58_TRINI|nr:gastrula zinc finger protein XlCGF57.1-like [Trichoplusia ni]